MVGTKRQKKDVFSSLMSEVFFVDPQQISFGNPVTPYESRCNSNLKKGAFTPRNSLELLKTQVTSTVSSTHGGLS